MAASAAGSLGLIVLSYAVTLILSVGFDGPFRVIEELLWLVPASAMVWGLLQLSNSVEERALPLLTAVAWIVMTMVDLSSLVFSRLSLPPLVSTASYDLSMLISLGARGLFLWLLVEGTRTTRPWVLPLVATVALLSVGRTALSVALVHGFAATNLYANPAYRYGTMLVSLFNLGAMLVATLALRESFKQGAVTGPVASGPRLGSSPVVSPASDFLVGGILLAVGVVVTVISVASASNGGRYVVATGAVGVGIGRIIRGFIRLAKR